MSLDGKSGTPRCSHFVTNFLNGRKKEKKKKRNKNIRNDRKLSNKYMRRIPNSANGYKIK